MMVPMGGGPGGMMGGASSGGRYNPTFGINASKAGTCVQAINHTNCAAPSGDLS
jgi:hypothetical protein